MRICDAMIGNKSDNRHGLGVNPHDVHRFLHANMPSSSTARTEAMHAADPSSQAIADLLAADSPPPLRLPMSEAISDLLAADSPSPLRLPMSVIDVPNDTVIEGYADTCPDTFIDSDSDHAPADEPPVQLSPNITLDMDKPTLASWTAALPERRPDLEKFVIRALIVLHERHGRVLSYKCPTVSTGQGTRDAPYEHRVKVSGAFFSSVHQ